MNSTKILFFTIFSLLAIFPVASETRIIEPRVEYLENPVGIDVLKPRLNWKITSKKRGWSQSAYRILVSSSLETLNDGDLWDSGKVESDENIQIRYGGLPLSSGQKYYWKVMVWDDDENPSEWSEPAVWSVGLLKPEDWSAEWIGYDFIPEKKEDDTKVVILAASYGVLDKKRFSVDVTENLRDLVKRGVYAFKVDNTLADGDPAAGRKKKLVLRYSLDGIERQETINENSEFDLLTGMRRKIGNKRYLPSPHLRKEFKTKKEVERAIIYVSAEGIFEMHLNGERIGDEYFMPGWTDYNQRIYYRAYDVTNFIQKGENALGAILGDGWFRGNISILGQNQYGKKLRLLAQLQIDYADGSKEVVKTDSSWKASFGPILESDMQAGETYDARLEIPDWTKAGFDETGWSAVSLGAQLDSVLQAYPGVPVRATRELRAVSVKEPVKGKIVFDLGQNFAGWVRLKIQGEAGQKIVMRFGEMLNPDGTVYTENLRSARAIDTYILKGGGEEIWEPHFTFHGFRYVELVGIEELPKADMITGIVVHSDAPLTSSFECSDPMLNQLHSNIIWGQLSNYLEVPTDCPQRDERLGWTGDTQVYIRSGSYHQDVAAFFTKWMVDLNDSVDKDGIFGQQAPNFHGYGSPGWSCAGVICPWTFYQVYGDKTIIEKSYSAMARYIESCLKAGPSGRVKGFGDWLSIGSKTPKDVISTAYLAYCSDLMSRMSEVLGKTEEAEKYREIFEQVRKHFQKSFVDSEGKIKGHTQTGYCMAIVYNLLTDKQREQAAAHLVERVESKDYHLSVGFLGVPILLPALTEIGRSDLAYRLLQNKTYPSWGYSVEQGATTIWERWNSYTKDRGITTEKMNSFNHYAYGACSEWMFYSMLGIDTEGAAYRKIKMKPEIKGGVEWAKGHYDSIHGKISSHWSVQDGSFQWKVEVPPNTTAVVYIPTTSIDSIVEGGKALEDEKGVKFLRIEDGRTLLEIGSGIYEFTSRIDL